MFSAKWSAVLLHDSDRMRLFFDNTLVVGVLIVDTAVWLFIIEKGSLVCRYDPEWSVKILLSFSKKSKEFHFPIVA